MRPFLLLIVLALLTTWLMWPDQKAELGVTRTSGPAPIAPAPVETPAPLNEEHSPLSRQTVADKASVEDQSTTPAMPTEKPASGIVFGQIVNSLGVPLSEGTVLIFERSELVAAVPLEGNLQQYSIELDAGKFYGFMVEPSSLKGGYLPPLKQSRDSKMLWGPEDLNSPDYFTKSVIKVEAGLTHQLNLTVTLPASVSGRILDSSGNPLKGIHVRISGLEEQIGIQSMDGISDTQGFFKIKEISAGMFRLVLHIDPAKIPPGEVWSVPPPKVFTLTEGQSHDCGEIRLGAGSQSIRGRVVNQDGDPFRGRVVLCYASDADRDGFHSGNIGAPLTRVITNEAGVFEMRGLESDFVLISCTSDFYPGQAMGAGFPAMWEHPLKVELLAESDLVDVGELVVHESRPFTVSGGLVFDPAWLAEDGNKKSKLKIKISQVEGEELPLGIRRNPIKDLRVPIDWETSSYAYKVETPMTAVRISFSLPGYADLRFVVRPEAMQSKSRTIQIPGDFEAVRK